MSSQLVAKYPDGLTRCAWPKQDDLYIAYHDTEWGVPLHGDDAMFERVCLEGFQAGLSWITILKRREGFRRVFLDFQIDAVAAMTESQLEAAMLDEGIIRNRAKVWSTVKNAQLAQSIEGGLSDLIWKFAPHPRTSGDAGFAWNATSSESDAMSRELKRIGFGFVGSTTMYALMQAVGLINDHAPGCFRREELRGEVL